MDVGLTGARQEGGFARLAKNLIKIIHWDAEDALFRVVESFSDASFAIHPTHLHPVIILVKGHVPDLQIGTAQEQTSAPPFELLRTL